MIQSLSRAELSSREAAAGLGAQCDGTTRLHLGWLLGFRAHRVWGL